MGDPEPELCEAESRSEHSPEPEDDGEDVHYQTHIISKTSLIRLERWGDLHRVCTSPLRQLCVCYALSPALPVPLTTPSPAYSGGQPRGGLTHTLLHSHSPSGFLTGRTKRWGRRGRGGWRWAWSCANAVNRNVEQVRGTHDVGSGGASVQIRGLGGRTMWGWPVLHAPCFYSSRARAAFVGGTRNWVRGLPPRRTGVSRGIGNGGCGRRRWSMSVWSGGWVSALVIVGREGGTG